MQVIEIIGILPNRVCGRARSNKLMDPRLTDYFPSETKGAKSKDQDISIDPQFSNNFPSETEGVGYEDGGIDRTIYFWGTEMPKWFNHQSVDNSIFFFVGRKFPKLAVCFVPGQAIVSVSVHISINGSTKKIISINGYKYDKSIEIYGNNLKLFSPTQRSLQRHLNKSNPADQNLVKVSITDDSPDPRFNNVTSYLSDDDYESDVEPNPYESDDDDVEPNAYESDDDDVEPNPNIEPLNPIFIKRWGVHVECTCPPKESPIPDSPTRPKLSFTAGDDDDWC